MSVRRENVGEAVLAARRRLEAAGRLAVRVLVGDRVGVALFLGVVTFVALYWRVGVFITDTYTPLNGLQALADGTLALGDGDFGSTEAPGTQVTDGKAYGRNYGQVALTLPFLWALQALTSVVDFGLAFATLWSLGVLALALQVGRLLDRPSAGATAGAVVALALFGLQAVLAEPMSERWLPLAALQLSAMTATALAATTIYRLLTRLHGRRTGVVAGALTVVATPVGFWASIPKRHVYVIAIVFGVAYTLSRSRTATTDDALLSATGFRALAYALVGLLTWIHAGEAFVVFLALVAVDVPTAPSNDIRTLAAVGVVFCLSMLPFFATNALISGNPLRPPRVLSQYAERAPDVGAGSGTTDAASSGGGSSAGGSGSAVGLPPLIAGPVSEARGMARVLFDPIVAGATVIVAEEPDALYRTLIRSGYIPGVGSRDHDQAINLTVLESGPLTAGVAAVAVSAVASLRSSAGRLRGSRSRLSAVESLLRGARRSPGRATDAFLLLSAVLFVLIYISRLPLHAQVTVRYLLILPPIAVYAMARQPALRRVVTERGRLALWTYAAGVLLGVQLLLIVVTVGEFGRGEAFQLHAVTALVAAAPLGALSVASAVDARFDRLTAVVGALAAALGTDFLLLSGVVYFDEYGQYALPASDYLADLLAAV